MIHETTNYLNISFITNSRLQPFQKSVWIHTFHYTRPVFLEQNTPHLKNTLSTNSESMKDKKAEEQAQLEHVTTLTDTIPP